MKTCASRGITSLEFHYGEKNVQIRNFDNPSKIERVKLSYYSLLLFLYTYVSENTNSEIDDELVVIYESIKYLYDVLYGSPIDDTSEYGFVVRYIF